MTSLELKVRVAIGLPCDLAPGDTKTRTDFCFIFFRHNRGRRGSVCLPHLTSAPSMLAFCSLLISPHWIRSLLLGGSCVERVCVCSGVGRHAHVCPHSDLLSLLPTNNCPGTEADPERQGGLTFGVSPQPPSHLELLPTQPEKPVL